jgi:hypothetical protein
VTETVRGKVEIRRSGSKGMLKPAKAEGLVAPNWSDSGEVPVGEVTYTLVEPSAYMYDEEDDQPVTAEPEPISLRDWFATEIAKMVEDIPGIAGVFEFPPEVGQKLAKPSDPNAKPSMPALSRIAGEAYRGLGWCDE